MVSVNRELQNSRVNLYDRRGALSAVVAAFAIVIIACQATNGYGQGSKIAEPPASGMHEEGQRTTVVVFSDRPMLPAQWTALFSALQTGLLNGGEDAQTLDETAEFVRGDGIQAGLKVDSAVVVYLHGNCELEPLMRRTAFGVPLGWVYRHQGRIEPFAHVDCTRIGEVLGVQALGVNKDRRASMMAVAVASVILHEWIHIATQCPAHAEQGIEKAQFGAADLLYGDSHPALSVRNR
jgi:hypothetical protein